MDASGNYSLLSWQAYLASSEADVFYLDCVCHNEYEASKTNLNGTMGCIWLSFNISIFELSNPKVSGTLYDITVEVNISHSQRWSH